MTSKIDNQSKINTATSTTPIFFVQRISSLVSRYATIWLGLLLAFRAGLAGFLPLTDPTEGRYATMAKDIAQRGHWLIPYVWHEGEYVPFLGKPPLVFWLQALAVKAFGVNEFSVRLPSLAALAGLLIFLSWSLRRLEGALTASVAMWATGSMMVLWVASGLAIVDMALAFWIVAAMVSLYGWFYESDRAAARRWAWLAAACCAGGFLTKGPYAVAAVALPTGFWLWRWKKWQGLRGFPWFSCAILFLALTAPWFIACQRQYPDFLRYFFWNENVLRFISPDYGDRYGQGHIYPRGSALWMAAACCLPWAALWAIEAVKAGWKKTAAMVFADDRTAFFVVGVAANALFWSAARQLLITYLFPVAPMAAIAYGLVAKRAQLATPDGLNRLKNIALFTIAATTVGYGIYGAVRYPHSALAIVRHVHRLEPLQVPPLYFVRTIPYSAYFYDDNVALISSDEFNRRRRWGQLEPNAYYVLENKYAQILRDDEGVKLKQVWTNREFLVVKRNEDASAKTP